jgi:hypothetical protein
MLIIMVGTFLYTILQVLLCIICCNESPSVLNSSNQEKKKIMKIQNTSEQTNQTTISHQPILQKSKYNLNISLTWKIKYKQKWKIKQKQINK